MPRVPGDEREDDLMIGPAEWMPCDRHPGHGQIGRWYWPVPEDGDHLAAIQGGGDAEIVASCPECDAEDEGA